MKLDQVIATRASKTVYRDGCKAIKVFNSEFSKADVLNEVLNHVRIEETGLAVPAFHEVTKIDNKWAIVFDFIEGKTLQQLISENPKKRNEYLDIFVKLQMEVHKKRAPLLTKLKDKMNRKISECKLDDATRYDLHTRLDSMPKHVKVCHGDFNPSNIIVSEEKDAKIYIIDWSHATQGNASADVARTYMLFLLANEDAFAEDYLELFIEETKTERSYIQNWLPIVAASQSVKDKPEELELLQRWTNVVDY